MAKIIIKKKVSLDFLGDDYKEAYIIFRAIPAAEFTEITDGLPKTNPRFVDLVNRAQKDQLETAETTELAELQLKEADTNKKIFHSLLACLKKYFHSGKFPDDKTGELADLESGDDLDGLDKDAVIKCFNVLTGQDDDPKDDKSSSTPSTTEVQPPTSS